MDAACRSRETFWSKFSYEIYQQPGEEIVGLFHML